MHPTFSIVFFTTAAGAGFGLLFLLGLGVPVALLPADPLFGLVSLGTAFVFAAGGLASSVFHLGRPERAWRAFSQWRSSWLSREGVLSVATAIPAAIFGIGWVFFDVVWDFFGLCGILAAALVGRDDLLHRDDLRLAEADPSVAQPLDRAELLCSGADVRVSAARPDRPVLGGPAGRRPDPDRRSRWPWPGCSRKPTGASSTRHRRCRLSRAPPRSAEAAGSACSNRRIRRTITCCRRWASGSPASTAPGCAWSRGLPPSRCPAS